MRVYSSPLSLFHLNSGHKYSFCAHTRDVAVVPNVPLFQTPPSPFFNKDSHSLPKRPLNVSCLLSLWHCPSLGQAFLLPPQISLAESLWSLYTQGPAAASQYSKQLPSTLRHGVLYEVPHVCPLLGSVSAASCFLPANPGAVLSAHSAPRGPSASQILFSNGHLLDTWLKKACHHIMGEVCSASSMVSAPSQLVLLTCWSSSSRL